MKKYHLTKIPEATIRRLSIYIRCLQNLEKQGEQLVSSEELGNSCCVNSAQIRKDLSYFGEFGIRGVGYNISQLKKAIKTILGLNKTWNIILVGAGNLGRALLNYPSFKKDSYNWVGAYDVNPAVINTQISGITVEDFNLLTKEKIDILKPDFAVITTPAEVAQDVADRLISFGIDCFLNFSPIKIKVNSEKGEIAKNVFLVTDFDNIAFTLSKKRLKTHKINI